MIHVIQDINNKQDENIQSTMTYAEEFLEFAATYQDLKQSNIDYWALFKSRRDTVTAHGGQPGYNLKMYDKHWKRLMATKGIIDE